MHCVEQLRNLRPVSSSFDKAGVEILAIGPGTVASLRASLDKLGSDSFQFQMLCDSKMRMFREWLAFDFLGHVGMHGVYLVGPQGRILWQDLSDVSFDHPHWLLKETQRILRLRDH